MEVGADENPDGPRAGASAPNRRAGWLLSGVALFAGVFMAVGLDSSELQRVWRNHSLLSHASVTLVLLAVALGAMAGWVLRAGDLRERGVLLWGNGLLGAGLIFAAWAGMATATDRPAPTVIAAAIDTRGGTILRVLASDSNLRAEEHLSIAIEPLFESGEVGKPVRYRAGRPFYSASLGPDKDGEVRRSIRVEIPSGGFDDVGVRASVGPPAPCHEDEDTTGCVMVRVRRGREEPRLSGAYGSSTSF